MKYKGIFYLGDGEVGAFVINQGQAKTLRFSSGVTPRSDVYLPKVLFNEEKCHTYIHVDNHKDRGRHELVHRCVGLVLSVNTRVCRAQASSPLEDEWVSLTGTCNSYGFYDGNPYFDKTHLPSLPPLTHTTGDSTTTD